MVRGSDQSAKRPRRIWAPAIVIVFVAMLLYALYRPIHSDIDWHTNFDSARDAAQERDRPLLLYFTGDWCGPCRQMNRWTWPDEQVEALVKNSFIPVKIDMPNSYAMVPLAERYNVVAVPTIIVADALGQPTAVLPGFATPSELVDLLVTAGKKLDTPG